MKIQCDVCDKAEASIFCPADEAALCHSCDRTIHHANKLATKHARFSLHYPTSKDFPLCDICQERRAYLFCQEDRALLCRECDVPIHRANEHTQKHNRFLLTGVKLSGTCLDPASSSTNYTNNNRVVTASEGRNNARSRMNRPRSSVSNQENASNSSCKVEDNGASDTGSISTSSISEYLIETIPGYCFEDLLDASFAPNGFCKKQNYDHPWAFQDQNRTTGDTMAVPFLKLVIHLSKYLNALDHKLFVKICLENIFFIFVICISFWALCILYDFIFYSLFPTTVSASYFSLSLSLFFFFSIFIWLINDIFLGGSMLLLT